MLLTSSRRNGKKVASSKRRTRLSRAAAPAPVAAGGGSKAPAQSAAAGGRAETHYSLTFSVQAQNLFNHTNAGTPIGNLRSTLFGQSNTLAHLYGFGNRPSAGNRRFEAQGTLALLRRRRKTEGTPLRSVSGAVATG